MLALMTPFAPIATLSGTLKESQSTQKKMLIISGTSVFVLLLLILIWGQLLHQHLIENAITQLCEVFDSEYFFMLLLVFKIYHRSIKMKDEPGLACFTEDQFLPHRDILLYQK